VDVRLIAGGDGIFDVNISGKLVFSKHSSQRFPEDGEISRLIRDQGYDRTAA